MCAFVEEYLFGDMDIGEYEPSVQRACREIYGMLQVVCGWFLGLFGNVKCTSV